MKHFFTRGPLTRIVVIGVGLLFVGLSSAMAQTGPGGVGTDDGLSNLRLWLRADQGITTSGGAVQAWADQSGYGNDASLSSGNPDTLSSLSAINDQPAVEFDGDDGFSLQDNGGLFSLPTGSNTVFVVSKTSSGATSNQYLLSIGGDDRLLGYEIKVSGTTYDLVSLNKGKGATLNSSNPSTSGFRVISSLFDGGSSNIDALLDAGNASATGSGQTPNKASSVGFLGQSSGGTSFLDGKIAEVIAFDRVLNAAEIRIVQNYLAAKYGRSINSTYDYYGFSAFDADVAGIGNASSAGPGEAAAGSKTAAASSILELNASLGGGNFALYGHDGDSVTSYTSSGNPPNAERLKREWRVDLTGTSSTSVSATVDLTSVSLGSGFNDFGLFVDGDGDFTTTGDQTFYDLEDGDGDSVYDASNVSFNDGDRVAVAQINRTVHFRTTSASKEENTKDTPNADLNVSLNYGDGSNVDVNVNTTGDLDNSGCIEDGESDESPQSCSSGSNANGDFEAGDGSAADDDEGSGPEGTFAGDYRFDGDPGSPRDTTVTISGGSSSTTVDLELDGDGLKEQTEKFEVTLSGIALGKASLGTATDATISILDDDEPREVKFADPDYTDGNDDPNYNPNSTEGSGGSSRVEQYTVKLRQDGDGETAASSSPYTSVEFSVDGASEANFGTDLSNPLVDVRIKDETGSDGTEYQERLSSTSGKVYFSSGARSSTLKLEINEDDLEDADVESIVLNLDNPTSSALEPDSSTMTFELQDDDTPPNVSFTSTSFSGGEDSDVQVNVELDQQAGTNLEVMFQDDGSGSATRGNDYTWPSDSTLSLNSGSTTGTFTLSVADDSETESNETLDLSIAGSGTEASLGSPTSTTYSIVDNDGVGSTGPGGVGATDGTGTLALWLNAESGVFSGSDCTGSVSDGTGVGCWQDQSGSGNNATQGTGGSQPTYRTGQRNGRPVIRFNGTDDVLKHSLTSIGSANNTVFAITRTTDSGTQQGIFAVAPNVENKRVVTARTLRFGSTDDAEGLNGDGTTPATGGTPGTSSVLLSSMFSGGTVDIGVNGRVEATSSDAGTESGTEGRRGAEIEYDNRNGNKGFFPTNHLSGDAAEVIAYTTDLNTPQRNIVRNYLSAKYNVSLAANDLYAGDADAGEFDHNVIGIGKEGGGSVSDAHTRAEGGGLTLSASSLANNPDYVLLGNQAEFPSTNDLNYTGTSGVSGLQARPDSIQFLSVTNSPTFNLTYDLSEIGLKAKAGDASGYVLLTAPTSCTPSNNNCSWSDAGGSVSVSGDEITFSGVSVASGDYYLSIGTTDEINSPLLHPWARTVAGGRGADEADAGWRFVGVPVQGATIDDLQPPVSPNRNGFVTHSVAMDYHWRLDEGGSNTDGWTELSSGNPVPNGRGFILYLYDDQYYPLDTEMPLDVQRNSGPPGATNVTVGNGSPSFDTPLHVDSTWHLLANPYAASFDLSGNLSGSGSDLSGSGFQSTIQIWDPNNGTYVTETQGTSGDELAPWQGFFVERSTQGGGDQTLTFDAGGRGAGSVDFVGSKSESNDPYRQIGLRLLVQKDGDEVARDEAVGIFFRDGAGKKWDAYDASKLVPFSRDYAALAALGTGRDSTRVPKALESRSFEPEDPFTVPLHLEIKEVQGEMTVEAREWTNIPDDWTVALVDTVKKKTIPLGPKASYTFDSESSKHSTSSAADAERSPSARVPPLRTMTTTLEGSPDEEEEKPTRKFSATKSRFRLRIDPGTDPLPATIRSMDATVAEGAIVLEWETASEKNNEGFYVEHQRLAPGDSLAALKAEAWEKRSFVRGAGTTEKPQSYRHRMEKVDYGRHVFRLRQVGTDGRKSYTTDPVTAEVLLSEAYKVRAPYPNPVRQQATIEVTVQKSQPVQLEIYDVLGRHLRTLQEDELVAQQTRHFHLGTRDLSSGLYFVRVKGKTFEETRRLTVVH